jgi:hypothetical protein
MVENHGPPDVTATDSRQATKEGVVRYVLGISLALVILGFLIAYLVR